MSAAIKFAPAPIERTPLNLGLNVAIRQLSNRSHPYGYHDTPDLSVAPTTLQGIKDYANKHDRFMIWSGDCDGTIYGCPETNMDLRAWHDKVHYDYNLEFNTAGEAAAVYIQIAQLMVVYGKNRSELEEWASILLTDILGLVVYHKRTAGKWPENKYQGTVENLPLWRPLGASIVETLRRAGPAPVLAALMLATKEWGNPRPLPVPMSMTA